MGVPIAIPDFCIHDVLPNWNRLLLRTIETRSSSSSVGMSFGMRVGKVRNQLCKVSRLCGGSMLVYMLMASILNNFAPFCIFPSDSRSFFTSTERMV